MTATNEAGWTSTGRDSTYHYSTTALSVFWPEVEHGKLIDRWPQLTDAVGSTWDEHRKKVEQYCARLTQAGHGVQQTVGDIVGLEAFLEEKRIKKPSEDDLHGYPDLRTGPVMISWPPARTAACWCGSGRKYKQCCRPHGLGTLD